MPITPVVFQRISAAAGTETIEVVNDTAGAIVRGQVVYASGIDGATGLTLVKLAKADATGTMPALGMMQTASVAAGARGFVRVNGDVGPIDTTWLGVDETIYVSNTVAGAVVSAAPSAPAIVQAIGFAVNSDAAGTFRVAGTGLTALLNETAVAVPAADGTPRAGADGKLDPGWFPGGLPSTPTAHDHTSAAGDGGVLTNDEHDGYSEIAEIAAPGTPAADKLRLYVVDEDGITRLEYVAADGYRIRLARDQTLVVRNQTGAELPKGSAIYVSSGTPGKIRVALAKADAEATLPAIGILPAALAHGADGLCWIGGVLKNMNTNAWNEGDRLYVSAADAGELVTTEPAAPNFKQRVAVVLVKHASLGTLYVNSLSVRGGPLTPPDVTQYEADFGAGLYQTVKSFTVVDAAVSPTSQIIMVQALDAPTGKAQDENEMDSFVCRCAPGIGQFTAYVESRQGSVAGKFKFNYLVG